MNHCPDRIIAQHVEGKMRHEVEQSLEALDLCRRGIVVGKSLVSDHRRSERDNGRPMRTEDNAGQLRQSAAFTVSGDPHPLLIVNLLQRGEHAADQPGERIAEALMHQAGISAVGDQVSGEIVNPINRTGRVGVSGRSAEGNNDIAGIVAVDRCAVTSEGTAGYLSRIVAALTEIQQCDRVHAGKISD